MGGLGGGDAKKAKKAAHKQRIQFKREMKKTTAEYKRQQKELNRQLKSSRDELVDLAKNPKIPPLPPLPEPTRLPTERDPEVLAASQRMQERARGRRGRMSTILTDAG